MEKEKGEFQTPIRGAVAVLCLHCKPYRSSCVGLIEVSKQASVGLQVDGIVRCSALLCQLQLESGPCG